MTKLIQIACAQRQELADAHKEITLLREALQARQANTPHALPTAAEIRLRAFDQTRAARGMADGYKSIGNLPKVEQWRAIACDFERAAHVLTTPG